MKINRYSRGSVSIVVLLACVVLSGAVQALYYSLREEIEAESKIVLHNQLQAATGDVMSCVLRKEQSSNLTESFRLEEQMLYPGQKVMQTEVVLERAESLPGRKVSVISIADDMQIRLAEVCLQPPLGRGQEFYENTLTAGRKINGDFNKYNDLICVGEAGDILETLDIGAYKKWSHYSFLTDDEYRQLGFGKGIYYSDDLYGARLPCIVEALKGDAFLISEKNITIENNLHLLGRVTIVVGDNLIIGDNVEDKAQQHSDTAQKVKRKENGKGYFFIIKVIIKFKFQSSNFKVNKQCQIKLNQVRCLKCFSSSSRR